MYDDNALILQDLDHSDDFVLDTLLSWHEQVATNYSIDGFR